MWSLVAHLRSSILVSERGASLRAGIKEFRTMFGQVLINAFFDDELRFAIRTSKFFVRKQKSYKFTVRKMPEGGAVAEIRLTNPSEAFCGEVENAKLISNTKGIEISVLTH